MKRHSAQFRTNLQQLRTRAALRRQESERLLDDCERLLKTWGALQQTAIVEMTEWLEHPADRYSIDPSDVHVPNRRSRGNPA